MRYDRRVDIALAEGAVVAKKDRQEEKRQREHDANARSDREAQQMRDMNKRMLEEEARRKRDEK